MIALDSFPMAKGGAGRVRYVPWVHFNEGVDIDQFAERFSWPWFRYLKQRSHDVWTQFQFLH